MLVQCPGGPAFVMQARPGSGPTIHLALQGGVRAHSMRGSGSSSDQAAAIAAPQVLYAGFGYIQYMPGFPQCLSNVTAQVAALVNGLNSAYVPTNQVRAPPLG